MKLQKQATTTEPATVVTPTAPVAVRATPSASAIYEGFKAQRDVLNGQLDELNGAREEVIRQLNQTPDGSPQYKSLTERLTDLDTRIKSVDGMIGANSIQLAQSAAVPGAVVPPPPFRREGPPEEAFVLGGMFIVVVLLPLSIAMARRIWRRSAAVVTSFPKELADRLLRLEQTTEATSLEVERIGEGQRFLTKLFTEGEGARALGAGAAQPIETRQQQSARDRLP